MLVIKASFNVKKAINNLGKSYKSGEEKVLDSQLLPMTQQIGRPLIKKELTLTKDKKIITEQFLDQGLPRIALERMVSVKSAPSESKKTDNLKTINIKKLDNLSKIPKLEKDDSELMNVNIKYPLSPPNPKKGEKVYAWCNIRWEPKLNSLIYYVIEPKLEEADKKSIEHIKEIIENKLNIRFESIKTGEASEYLKKSMGDIIKKFEMKISPQKREIYEYYILRDFIGLERIQAMMNDPNIEDISCDGVKIPIYIYHRNPKYGSVKTNVLFNEHEEVDSFVMKLSQRAGRSISVAEPIVQGALPNGSRVQATLGTDIARRGSNFTIRRFTKDPLTPINMLDFGTLDEKSLAYLWLMIENNKSILVSGATATGKTSLLNVLSLFIRPNLKIVSIEDTPELRLPHTHWIPEVARESTGSTQEGKTFGTVDMFDLLKSSLRQRPDYIIVGEVRGKEAYVLFQQMATGHPGLSTIHANSLEKVIDRLSTPPISLPISLLETLDIIVFLERIRYKGSYARRVRNIIEIVEYDSKNKFLNTREVFRWAADSDKFLVREDSVLLSRISESLGLRENQLQIELLNRIKVLRWMKEKRITYYKNVSKVISAYYSNPQKVIDFIEGE